jgi:hypothetical protein
VTKEQIITISNAMFTENLWGFGILGNCGPEFARDLQKKISPLWDGKLAPHKTSLLSRPKPKVAARGRTA